MRISQVPDAKFHTRVRNDTLPEPNPFEWKTISTSDVFAKQKVVLFAVPGAFTPACSESHLPGYERLHDEFIALGVDRVICLSVNDAFVMFNWAKSQAVEKVFMLPDGNGEFTRKMGMLVERTAQGMGLRSWRYSMFVDDCNIKKIFTEAGFSDNPAGVPADLSSAERMLEYLKA